MILHSIILCQINGKGLLSPHFSRVRKWDKFFNSFKVSHSKKKESRARFQLEERFGNKGALNQPQSTSRIC